MPFVAEGSGCAGRIDRVLCGRTNRPFGAHPCELLLQQPRRSKLCKGRSNSGDSGFLSCLWVGFPPAPRFQLQRPTALTVSTTSYHFVPHLSAKSFIVKQKLDGPLPTWTLFRETTKACG